MKKILLSLVAAFIYNVSPAQTVTVQATPWKGVTVFTNDLSPVSGYDTIGIWRISFCPDNFVYRMPYGIVNKAVRYTRNNYTNFDAVLISYRTWRVAVLRKKQ